MLYNETNCLPCMASLIHTVVAKFYIIYSEICDSQW